MTELKKIPFADLLTPNEVANLIGVQTSTLSRWRVERRHLAFVKIGGRVRYRRETVEAFIAQAEHQIYQ